MCGVSPQFLLWCLDRVEQLLYKVFFLSRLPRSLSVGERKQPFWGLFAREAGHVLQEHTAAVFPASPASVIAAELL